MSDGSRATWVGRLPAGQAGRGLIGFFIALVVVGFGAYSLKQWYDVKSRYDQINDFAYEAIRGADRAHQTPEDVRFAILKRARELNVPLGDRTVNVLNDAKGWSVSFSYDDVIPFPGMPQKVHRTINHTWTRF